MQQLLKSEPLHERDAALDHHVDDQSRGLGGERGAAAPAEPEALGALPTAYDADPHGVSLGRKHRSIEAGRTQAAPPSLLLR